MHDNKINLKEHVRNEKFGLRSCSISMVWSLESLKIKNSRVNGNLVALLKSIVNERSLCICLNNLYFMTVMCTCYRKNKLSFPTCSHFASYVSYVSILLLLHFYRGVFRHLHFAILKN